MKTLYLDCAMGMAGDMLMGALLELMPDKNEFINEINSIGIPEITVSKEESVKCGVLGTHIKVLFKGEEEHSQDMNHDEHNHDKKYLEEHIHNHENTHHHKQQECSHVHNHMNSEHIHHHASMHDIGEIINNLQIPEKVKNDVLAIYQLIAEAESKVHGKKVSEIHFHEVGMMDAIADITGCALLIHELEIDKVISSPVNVGFGQVKCAHGILPVPAPATADLLIGIPCYAGNIKGELCTPTGAALLKYFVKKFSNMPPMMIEKIGYGMGKKDFDAANCVRAILGYEQ